MSDLLEIIISIIIGMASPSSPSQTELWSHDVARRIDSLITANAHTPAPFNGVVLVSYPNSKVYYKASGYADRERRQKLRKDTRFYIGSISKQITAVLALQQIEAGTMALDTPIHKYLPDLTASWADSVTIYHLLSHTSGIKALDQPLATQPGNTFVYSNLGFELLAKCIEKAAGVSFEYLSANLFQQCKMDHSAFPDTYNGPDLATGYTFNGDSLHAEHGDLRGHAASGTFISSAADLAKWNHELHGDRKPGKLLQTRTYTAMTTPIDIAFRQHPAFDSLAYGYGITWVLQGEMEYVGTTGIIPGFVSMDFYDPKRHVSVIVLENTAWSVTDVKKMFYYHKEILKIAADLP